MTKKFEVDKDKLKDKMGRPLTQSLFLECGYNTEFAVYTLGDTDKEYEGKVYPSLKRLFLEEEDVTGYLFANKYLLGWKHWQRLKANQVLLRHIEEWEAEIEIRLKALGIKGIIDVAASDTGFQANRWLAERGWVQRSAGRPSKEELDRSIDEDKRLLDKYSSDIERLGMLKVVKG